MKYDVKELSYEKVKVFGQNALFTEDRIIRESVPHGFYLYEVRHDDDCQGNPVEVKKWIMVNFLGTLLLREPIEEVECKGYVWIGENDWDYESYKSCTLEEYLSESKGIA